MNIILQQRIEEAAAFLFKQRGLDKESCRQAMEYILSNQWISVGEALPQKDDLYFVLINNTHPRVTEFENGKWQGYNNITHWMEIPKNT